MARLKGLTPLLKTHDIVATIEFYTSVLGFTVDSAWPEEAPTWCMLDRGDVHLMFYSDDEHDRRPPAMTGRLYVYVDDVMEVWESVNERVKVVDPPEVYHYGMHEFCIEDVNGYQLAFGQPTDAEPTCPES